MAHCEYFVIKRSGQWWLTINGARRGPFVSRQAAVDAGIHAAKLDFKEEKSARVSVEEPDGVVPVIYDSAMG